VLLSRPYPVAVAHAGACVDVELAVPSDRTVRKFKKVSVCWRPSWRHRLLGTRKKPASPLAVLRRLSRKDVSTYPSVYWIDSNVAAPSWALSSSADVVDRVTSSAQERGFQSVLTLSKLRASRRQWCRQQVPGRPTEYRIVSLLSRTTVLRRAQSPWIFEKYSDVGVQRGAMWTDLTNPVV